MAFRQQAHGSVFDLVVDDNQSFAFGSIEGCRRLTCVHRRQQHVVLVIEVGLEADLGGIAIHRIGVDFRHEDHAGITPVIMCHDNPLRRA